jgi:hypothetical protein
MTGRPGDFDPELAARWKALCARGEVGPEFRPAIALWCPFCRARKQKQIVIAAVYAEDGSDRGVFHERPTCVEWQREPDAIAFLDAMKRRIAP